MWLKEKCINMIRWRYFYYNYSNPTTLSVFANETKTTITSAKFLRLDLIGEYIKHK